MVEIFENADKTKRLLVKNTEEPPIKMIKPSICSRKVNDVVKSIIFAGGNEEGQCVEYVIESDQWR